MFKITQKPKPLVLCIVDGWGVAPNGPGNAITTANPLNFNGLLSSYPHTLLVASGQAVGLPEGRVGNSEVGHLNLGAGRVVVQAVQRINTAIADGAFYENKAFLKAIQHIAEFNSNIHLMGLVGSGSVHSDMEHFYALLRLLASQGVPASKVKLHIFTDGRDSPPTSAKIYVGQLENRLREGGLGQIASIGGRYWAMDKDNRWDRTQKAYEAITGQLITHAKDVMKAIEESYINGITDEFIEPTTIVDEEGNPVGPVQENDSIIFLNFRPDRARQLSYAFVLEDLSKIKEVAEKFKRGPKIKNLFFVSMTNYESNLSVSEIAFETEKVTMPIARVLSERNAKQLHIAETEKYAHITYFFNGGIEKPFEGEERILIDSPKVASYDQAPEMSAPQITRELAQKIASSSYDFIVVNFANADMLAHTGNIQATIKGVACVDFNLGVLVTAVLSVGGGIIVTADHGNAEVMINPSTGLQDTEHNASPVPCIFVLKELAGKNVRLSGGILADVAPTILSLLGIPKPAQMTGKDLL